MQTHSKRHFNDAAFFMIFFCFVLIYPKTHELSRTKYIAPLPGAVAQSVVNPIRLQIQGSPYFCED